MTDGKNKNGGGPDYEDELMATDEDLLAELEAWDATFDSLHTSDDPVETLLDAPGRAGFDGGEVQAELVVEAGRKTGREATPPTAMGKMPAVRTKEIFTSARPPSLSSAASDDSLSGRVDVSPSVAGAVEPWAERLDADERAAATATEDLLLGDEFADEDEDTRVSHPGREAPWLVIRRPPSPGPGLWDEELLRGADDADGEPLLADRDITQGERTAAVSPAAPAAPLVGAESGAAAASRAMEDFFDADSPAYELEADEDFYDDIDIAVGEDAGIEPRLQDADTSTRRRTTAHLVRRAPPPRDEDNKGVVVEIEAEPQERFAADRGAQGASAEIDPFSEPELFPVAGPVQVAPPRAAAPSRLASEPAAGDRPAAAAASALALEDDTDDIDQATVLEADATADGGAKVEPELDLAALRLPEEVEAALEDRSEDLAKELLLYERELELVDEPGAKARLHLEAGRLAERLGDLDVARHHYRRALQSDPPLTSALRALRRVERRGGRWSEAIAYLDQELGYAVDAESRALSSHRLDLLMAADERDLAGVAVIDLLDSSPGDVRALLTAMELAYVGGRLDELDQCLETLAEALEDAKLAASAHKLRGRLAEASGRDADARDAFVRARDCDPEGLGALAGSYRIAARGPSPEAAMSAVAEVVEQAKLESRDPALAAALLWRRAQFAVAARDSESERQAHGRACELVADDPVLLSGLARACDRREDATGAVQALHRLARAALEDGDRVAAYLRAADLLSGPLQRAADAAEDLRCAAALDPLDAVAAADLERVLVAAGDIESLVALDRSTVAADPRGAVFERIRMAHRLVAAGRLQDAVIAVEEGLAAGVSSSALIDVLQELYAASGRRGERARLLARVAEGELAQVDPELAHWAAARAAEDLAYQVLAHGGSEPAHSGSETAIARRDQHRLIVKRAIEAWQTILDFDPTSAPAHSVAIRLADAMGDARALDSALAAAQRAAQVPVVAVGLALRRVALLIGSVAQSPQAAEAVLHEVLPLVAEDPRLVLPLVINATRAGRWTEAGLIMQARARALGDGDEAWALRFRAAALLLERGDEPERAIELLLPLVEAKPSFAAASDLLAAAHRRLGEGFARPQDRDAAAALPEGQLRSAREDSFVLLIREAERYEERSGDPAGAVSLYEKALTMRPGSSLARDGFVRAATAARDAAGLAELALADLRQAEYSRDAAAKADAYEELARIDAELRGDLASALLGWQAAARSDPQRQRLLRILERAYLRAGRAEDVYLLYGQLAALLGDSPEAAAIAHERARLAEALGLSNDEVAGEYEQALALAGSSRMALFELEHRARCAGPSTELAALEDAIAEYFVADARARAAFLTRAGETHLALGAADHAIARFRAACEVAPGYSPAFFGWRRAALFAKRWMELAEATAREAATAQTELDRVALFHLTGLILMDRAGDNRRAIAAFKSVLELDPRHRDALARLRVLLENEGAHQELAALLTSRLAVEEHPAPRIELHFALADLCRDHLGDGEEAKRQLRAVLALEPDNLAALAALSDIAWDEQSFVEAAEMLIARAKRESDPRVLNGLFSRLGAIYADHVPDLRWAIKSFQKVLSYDPSDRNALKRLAELGRRSKQWKMALGAYEQLIKLAERPAERIRYLHCAGAVFLEGFGDRARAERAFRVALDLDPTDDRALTELVAFFARCKDMRSLRVHLDRVAASMRKRIAAQPDEGIPYRVLARALEAREQTGVAGSLATARCAAEMAQLLGAGEDPEARLAAHAAQVRPRVAALAKRSMDDLLFPRSVASELRQIFHQLGDRINKHLGIDMRRYGVGRGDRIDPGDGTGALLHQLATDLGFPALEVYLSRERPRLVVAPPTQPAALILGADLVADATAAELRFVAVRALKGVLASLAAPACLPREEFGIFLAALLRQFQPDFTVAGLDAQRVADEQQRLRRLIPSGVVQELRPFAVAVAVEDLDYEKIWAGVREAGNRAGLLATGSISTALSALAKMRGRRGLGETLSDPAVTALIDFALSDEHAALRAAMGG